MNENNKKGGSLFAWGKLIYNSKSQSDTYLFEFKYLNLGDPEMPKEQYFSPNHKNLGQ